MTFSPGDTLTAAELNQLIPPSGALLGGTGTTFSIVNLGSGLALSGGALNANWQLGTVTALLGLAIVSGSLEAQWQGPAITALGSGVSGSGGTLTATGSGGSVTQVNTGAGLTGGPINSSGTVSFAAIAAASLIANTSSASAVPSAVPLGAGLAFSGGSLAANYQAGSITALGSGVSLISGTLSATGTGGSVTSVVAGTGLNGGTITTTGTLTANYQAGTLASFATGLSLVGTALTPAVAAAGNGIAINSGTITIDSSSTLQGTVAGTLTIAPASGVNNVLVNMPTAAGTVTLAAAPAYQYQRAVLNIKQGSTPQSVSLNSGFVFATSGGPTGYTATATASARDILGLYSPDGTHWLVDGMLQGVTI